MYRITILDGYIDEPTCLGVPPYISPYPRYIAGAIHETNPEIEVFYITIDQIRSNPRIINYINQSEVLIVIAGMSVPGRYLSGYPASPYEISRILSTLQHPLKLLCGPAAKFGFGIQSEKKSKPLSNRKPLFHAVIPGDPEIVISEFLNKQYDLSSINLSAKRPNASSIRCYAITGSSIVTQHPNFPDRLITEIETYRGCPRSISGGCSFCSEPFKGLPDFRPIDDIVSEIHALYTQGVRHFRIGGQPCLFTYMSPNATKNEIPTPNPDAIESLFSQIRYNSPKIKTLHIDNVNPIVVAKHPEASKKIIQTIIKYHSPGDVAAFGVESVDPIVIKENNLKATQEEIIQAIKLFNTQGKTRGSNGLPELLPGLNFVFGLIGETVKTYEKNYQFLQKILKNNLLIRRINLRQVIPIPGTRMEKIGIKIMNKHKAKFKSFKYQVQHTIDQPLLQQMLPHGTILTEVICELWKGKTTFGRQLGSYPLLVGIPGKYPLFKKINTIVIDHGYRSITALPYPLNINSCPRESLEHLPGIGSKRAIRLLRYRPYQHSKDILKILDDPAIAKKIIPYLTFT